VQFFLSIYLSAAAAAVLLEMSAGYNVLVSEKDSGIWGLIEGSLPWLGAGKFRHLPVVEHGEVVALLDITKCLYDAIARMERAAEKGGAIAAAVKGVEQWGQNDIGKSLLQLLFFSCLLLRFFCIKLCSESRRCQPQPSVLASLIL
jgi:hypothetical protein